MSSSLKGMNRSSRDHECRGHCTVCSRRDGGLRDISRGCIKDGELQ